jgi:hypothetical protein
MIFGNKKIKIIENKGKVSLSSPRFIIDYVNSRNKTEDGQSKSYELISLLKNKSDVFVEVNSLLLSLPESKREGTAMDFIKSVKALGLDYRYRKIGSSRERPFFKLILNRESNENHEILVRVPNTIWEQETFKSILPLYGVRYYICNKSTDENKILDAMYNGQLLDEEKIDLFNLIIFDYSNIGHMGIIGNNFTLEDLEKRII